MKLTKVKVRQRPVSGGRLSIFLVFYPEVRHPRTMKMIRWEFLHMYLWANPKNAVEKAHNKEMLIKAEGIRSIRVQSIINEEFGFLDKNRLDASFLDYYREHLSQTNSKALVGFRHFEYFCSGKCTFNNLTVAFCHKYRARVPAQRSKPTQPCQ